MSPSDIMILGAVVALVGVFVALTWAPHCEPAELHEANETEREVMEAERERDAICAHKDFPEAWRAGQAGDHGPLKRIVEGLGYKWIEMSPVTDDKTAPIEPCGHASSEAIVAELNALRDESTKLRDALEKIAYGGPSGTGLPCPWDVAREALAAKEGAAR